MAITKDHSALPTAARTTEDGRKPDPSPTFLKPYLDHLAATNAAEGERPHAVAGTRFRHSMAAACSRQIAFHALDVPASNPMDLAGIVVTGNGTNKHDEIQAVLVKAYGDALQIEVPCQIPGLDGSGSADAVLNPPRRNDASDSPAIGAADGEGGDDAQRLLGVDGGDVEGRVRGDRSAEPRPSRAEGSPGGLRAAGGSDPGGDARGSPLPEQGVREPGAPGGGDAGGEQPSSVGGPRVCWELKNVGGFAFKMAVGERGAPQGPKHAHIVQGALNALAMDADLLVVTYMTWEAISVNVAKRKGFDEAGRVAAQWTFTRDEWEPLARAEVERVTKILACVDGGELPARVIPDPDLPAGHRIVHPRTGGWEVRSQDDTILDAGEFWACGYCRWQDTCQQTKSGRQPIAEVAVTLGLELEGEAA